MPGRRHKSYQRFSNSDPADTATDQRSGKAVTTSAGRRRLSSSSPVSFGSAALQRYSSAVSLAHGASSPTACRSPTSRRYSDAAEPVRVLAVGAIALASGLRPAASRRTPWRARTVLVFHTDERYEI